MTLRVKIICNENKKAGKIWVGVELIIDYYQQSRHVFTLCALNYRPLKWHLWIISLRITFTPIRTCFFSFFFYHLYYYDSVPFIILHIQNILNTIRTFTKSNISYILDIKKSVSHCSDWQLACKRQSCWDLAQGACGQRNMCTVNNLAVYLVWLCEQGGRDGQASYAHTGIRASSPASISSQSARYNREHCSPGRPLLADSPSIPEHRDRCISPSHA